MEIIINQHSINHYKIIKQLINKSEEIFVSVAFLKKSGLDLIMSDLETALENNSKITIVCGLDFYQTEPDALKDIQKLTEKFTRCQLFINNTIGNITFHPKLYCFTTHSEVQLLVGSANLTKGGFQDNIEISLLQTIEKESTEYDQLIQYRMKLIEESKKVDEFDLSQYKRKYQINRRNSKKAKETSKNEVDKIFNLNWKRVETYLKQYNSDKSEQLNYQRRKDNYKKAKEILEIIRSSDLDEDKFFNYYESLVGRKDEKSLWHSGSIKRHKSKIFGGFQAFKKLVHDTVKYIDKSPQETFDNLSKYFKKGSDKKIRGVGPNIVTEIMHTYRPETFAVLNDNPLTSLKYFGFEEFPNAQSFSATNYDDFNTLIAGFMKACSFETMGQVDHFLNFVYWQVRDIVKSNK
ncbi:MAG: hypothetical protein HZB30_06100 [Nitrospirae bacterium]|nr:hypothetical protein [Nitrospirota bacterium]